MINKEQAQKNRTAAALKDAVFYKGRPCKHGHKGKRYTKSKACKDCESSRPRRGKKKPNK